MTVKIAANSPAFDYWMKGFFVVLFKMGYYYCRVVMEMRWNWTLGDIYFKMLKLDGNFKIKTISSFDTSNIEEMFWG